VFTSLVAPARVAFIQDDSQTWVIINAFVDFAFLLDIFIIFNTAVYDKEFTIIHDRKIIAKIYI
jgi:hypothetical protein